MRSAVPSTSLHPFTPTSATNVRAWLWAICGLALAVRVIAIVVLHPFSPNAASAMEHRTIALHLVGVGGHGFTFNEMWGTFDEPTSVQSPLFPYLLATCFRIFGPDAPAAYGAMMVVNAFLGAASCALAYAMIRSLRGTAGVGLVAAGLIAVWPTQVYATTAVQAITFITCCTVAVIWLFYRSVDTGRLAPWIAYGLVGCLGALTEPVLLPFMALSGLLILFWPGLSNLVRVRNAAVLFLCAAAVLGPWMIRNYRVHGVIMPVKSTFWVNVWKGNNPNATGTDRLDLNEEQLAALDAHPSDEQLRDPNFDGRRQYELLTAEQRAELQWQPEVQREKIFAKYAKAFIREHPGRYAQLCAIRFWKTVWIEAGNPKAHGPKQLVLYWTPRTILLLLTPVGLVLAWRRGWRMAIPLLVVGSALLTYTLTIAAARFALPYEPWQLGLVALVLCSLRAGPSPGRTPRGGDAPALAEGDASALAGGAA